MEEELIHKPKNIFFTRPDKLVMWVDIKPSPKIYKFVIVNLADYHNIPYKGNSYAYTQWNVKSLTDIKEDPFNVLKGKLFRLGFPNKALEHAYHKYACPFYKELDESKRWDAELHISRPNTKTIKIHYLKRFENNKIIIENE